VCTTWCVVHTPSGLQYSMEVQMKERTIVHGPRWIRVVLLQTLPHSLSHVPELLLQQGIITNAEVAHSCGFDCCGCHTCSGARSLDNNVVSVVPHADMRQCIGRCSAQEPCGRVRSAMLPVPVRFVDTEVAGVDSQALERVEQPANGGADCPTLVASDSWMVPAACLLQRQR
jgi:hypothetical protein